MKRQNGFTLIEVAIVVTILGVVLLAAVMLARGTQGAYESLSQDTELNFYLRRALEKMTDELRRCTLAQITIENSDPGADAVEFSLPLGVSTDTVIWGAEGQPGWRVRFLVEDGVLVRRVVDGTGTIRTMDQVLATGVDGLRDGRKGFSVAGSDSLFTLSLRLVTRDHGRQWRREISTAVSLRN